MKILITGVAGFVGSTLARALLKNSISPIEIIGVDDFSYGYRSRINDIENEITFIETNFLNIRTRQIDNIDAVVHCAAIAPLPDNQVDHYLSLEQNVAMCGALVDFCTLNGIKKIIHFSSAAVYEKGKSKNGSPASLEHEITPTLMYPTSKWLSELYLETQAKAYGLDIVALRLFNLYGPRQDYFRKQPPLLGYLIKNILEDNEVVLYASENARRDYIYIDDLLSIITKILRDSNDGDNFKVVNIGSGNSYNIYEIINILEDISGKKLKWRREVPEKYWANFSAIFDREIPLNYNLVHEEIEKMAVSDISETVKIYNWTPSVAMFDGLKQCYDYAKEEFKK